MSRKKAIKKRLPLQMPKKSILSFDISIGGTGLEQIALFAKHLSIMLQSGLTIAEALSIAEDSGSGKFRKILKKLLKAVESGRSFSSALANYPKVFSPLFINAVYAGETSGTLEENLTNVAKQLEKDKNLIAKIKGAMIYPIVVLIAAFALGMVLSFLVLPKIMPLFMGLKTELPLTTRWLIVFSRVIETHGTVIFFGIVAGIIFLSWLLRQKFIRPFTHGFFLKVPIIKKISKNSNLARFTLTLGTLLKSGLTIDNAIEISEKTVSNFYYQQALAMIGKQMGGGTKLSNNLAYFEDLFPRITTKMIRVGEESGRLDETLLYLADFYEDEIDIATKSLSTAIEPILLIGIGLVVGFLALSIITPIYEITGSIRR